MTSDVIDRNHPPSERRIALVNDRRDMDLYDGSLVDAHNEQDEDAIDLRQYWRILVRRRWTVILFALVAITATAVWTMLQTPIYRSTMTLKIERDAPKFLEYDTINPQEGSGWNSDFYQTQYELLQSRSLARRVAEQLGLGQKQADDTNSPSLIAAIKNLLSGTVDDADARSEGNTAEEQSSRGSAIVMGGLSVVPVRNSRLVTLNFDDPDPRLAARVLNTTADAFINTTLERRFDASSYAKKFLQERLEQVKANLEDSEKKLAEYTSTHEIIDLEDREGILQSKLRLLSEALVEADAQRIELEAEYQGMMKADNLEIVRVQDDPTVQSLRATLAQLESEYQEKLRIFKPKYPKMQQLQSQIDQVNKQIDFQVDVIRSAVRNAYRSRVREEAKLQAEMNTVKDEILSLRGKTTDFQTLEREVDTNRQLYDGLLQRMKEVGVVAGIGTNNISIVDAAEVPAAPFKPNLQKNLMLAMVLGLMGGIGLALLFEHLDDTVKSSHDLEAVLHKPVLGIVPMVHPQKQEAIPASLALMTHADPKSALAEAFRSLRTALQFSTADGTPKVLHYTSSGPGEGKTTSAINAAIAYAQTGANVLLIDADLRNPSLHKEFELKNTLGLTNYLAGKAKPADIAQPTRIANLFVITSGPISPNPAELLHSGKMADMLSLAAERFAYVIVDGPPILGLADALVLSNMAHASVMVVEAGVTRKGALEGALKRLRNTHSTIVGGILTKYGRGGRGYGYGYDYDYHYHYNYYYSYEAEVTDDTPKKRLAS